MIYGKEPLEEPRVMKDPDGHEHAWERVYQECPTCHARTAISVKCSACGKSPLDMLMDLEIVSEDER